MKVLKSVTKWGTGLMVCALMLSLTSCKQKSTELTDPEIASVAVTANQIDVNYGNIALKKSQNSLVRHFAQTMITDHTNIINQAVALAKKLGVTPKTNAVTKSLLDGEKKTEATFSKLSGKDFDQAYIDNEVAYHEAVIKAVKNTLIPQTKNEQLKQMLIKVTPLLEEHLKMAKEARANVKVGKGAIPQFTDAQIASIAVVANQVDIDWGKIALKRSDNDMVKHFAQTMVTDHSNIIKAAVALAKKLGVTPDNNNALTQKLLKEGKQMSAKLNGLSGHDFDKTYIDNEAAYHKTVVGAIENVLIPQTDNAELKKTLQSVLPLLKEHLKMANADKAKINK